MRHFNVALVALAIVASTAGAQAQTAHNQVRHHAVRSSQVQPYMQGNAVLHKRDIGGGFDSQLQGNATDVPVLHRRDMGDMPGALMGGTKEQNDWFGGGVGPAGRSPTSTP
jgi:hypothetical protein